MYDRYTLLVPHVDFYGFFTSQPGTKSGRSDKVKSLKYSKLSEMYSLGSDGSLNTSEHRFISPFFHRTANKGVKSAYFPIIKKALGTQNIRF